jgi:hypothetical protein
MKGSINKVLALFIIAMFAIPIAVVFDTLSSDGGTEFVSYYDQLDANGKAVYDAMESANPYTTTLTVNLPIKLTVTSNGTVNAEGYLKENITSTINDALDILVLSSPLAYWGWGLSFLDWEKMGSDLTVVGNTATVTSLVLVINLGNYSKDQEISGSEVIAKMLGDLNSAVNAFTAKGTSVRDKVMDINNYLVNLITYDPNIGKENGSRYSHDAYGALVDPNHYAVCDGYSKAFLLLCEKEGIESVLVKGVAVPSLVGHAWNYVKMDDGKWYAMDVTWNDNGTNDNPYFLKGGETFFATHQQGMYLLDSAFMNLYPFDSPTISGTDYDKVEAINQWYVWALYAAIVAVLSVALFRFARRGR